MEVGELQKWCKDPARALAPYTIPSEWRFVDAMPRNAMGKVNKKELVAAVFGPKDN